MKGAPPAAITLWKQLKLWRLLPREVWCQGCRHDQRTMIEGKWMRGMVKETLFRDLNVSQRWLTQNYLPGSMAREIETKLIHFIPLMSQRLDSGLPQSRNTHNGLTLNQPSCEWMVWVFPVRGWWPAQVVFLPLTQRCRDGVQHPHKPDSGQIMVGWVNYPSLPTYLSVRIVYI